MLGNLTAILNKLAGEYTPPAGLRNFREGKHSAGHRRKTDPRKKRLRKIRQAAKRGNRGK